MEVIKIPEGFKISQLNMKIVKTPQGYKIEGGTASSCYLRIGDAQICWGRIFIDGLEAESENIHEVTLPMPFKSNSDYYIVWNLTNCSHSVFAGIVFGSRPYISRVSKSVFWWRCYTSEATSYTGYVSWVAIGKWE